ncbi:MAG: PspC domain-containing protein [Flavobacteriales bacterium]|nr:PspC domain-containing protein [Flavobacteriales bacterium]
MNKTVTANISGFIFNIEEEAYQKLLEYLNSIKRYYETSDGGQEIVDDIESRIAELFQERLHTGKQVITMKDIDEVIEIMGRPEQYDEEFEEEQASSGYSTAGGNYDAGRDNRKIFRDPDHAVAGGVCAGFSHYLGWDPLVLRLILLASFLFAGSGLILYLILWAVIPEAKTTAEKLRMRGEKINVENISRKVNEEFSSAKQSFNKFSDEAETHAREAGASINGFFQKFFNGLGSFFEILGKVLLKGLGAAFLIAGLGIFVGLIAGWLTFDNLVLVHEHISWDMLDDLIFHGGGNLTLLTVAAVMFAISLSGMFILAGVRMMLDIQSSTKPFFIVLFVLFVTSIFLGLTSSFSTMVGNANHTEISEEVDLQSFRGDTLNIALIPDQFFDSDLDHDDAEFLEMMRVEGDEVILGDNVTLYFYPVDSASRYYLEVEKSATGRTNSDAVRYARNIAYQYNLDNDTLNVSGMLRFPYSDEWHVQEVDLKIFIPDGQTVCLSDNIGRVYWNHHREGRCMIMEGRDWKYLDE